MSAEKIAQNYCCGKGGELPAKVPNHGLDDVPRFLYPAYFVDRLNDNPTDSWLGSITKADVKVESVDCCYHTAEVSWELHNESGAQSATHFPPPYESSGPHPDFLSNLREREWQTRYFSTSSLGNRIAARIFNVGAAFMESESILPNNPNGPNAP